MSNKHLRHHTGLAVIVGIGLGIELVTKAGLGLTGLATVIVTVAGHATASRIGAVGVSGATFEATATHLGCGGVGGVANLARLTLEAIITLLTAGKNTTLLLEVLHGDGGKSRGAVVLGGVVVDLMDWDGSVSDVRLDGLLLNHRLNLLVDMVVHVLASNDRSDRVASLALYALGGILELSLLGCQATLNILLVVVFETAVLDWDQVVVVLLAQSLLLDYGLHRGVVVVLVNLLVDRGGNLLTVAALNSLVLDGGVDLLVNGGVVVTRLGHEVFDGSLGRVHCGIVGVGDC